MPNYVETIYFFNFEVNCNKVKGQTVLVANSTLYCAYKHCIKINTHWLSDTKDGDWPQFMKYNII